MNLNKAIIVGRVTQDPQLKTTPSGQSVCNFSIATNRTWTNQETKEKQEKAEFHNIVAWGRLAEISNQYLKKGGLVLIEGRIETRSWEDQSGNRRYRTEIIAENMQLGPRPYGNDGASSYGSAPDSGRKQKDLSSGSEEIPIIESDTPVSSGDDDSEEGEINVKNIPF